MKTLRCEVQELTDQEAVIVMVESNFQRSVLLPSEKAFAYKMRLDAMKMKAGRPSKDNFVPLGQNSRDELAKMDSTSQTQIQRYIRLTKLVPELLEMVDNSVLKEKDVLQMALRPAVELTYLDEDSQRDLVDAIDDNACTPTHEQAKEIRRLFEAGELTTEKIYSIMEEDKPNQREHISLRLDRVTRFIPASVPITKREDYILKALEWYQKHLRKREERDAR
jgi:ParB family chromosome partitioning protein